MGGWVVLLVLILTVWNPAMLALEAAARLTSLPPPAALPLLFLGVRLLLTGVGMAAGLALARRRPAGVRLAQAALVLFAVEAVARMATRVDLGTAPPGTRLPMAAAIVLHNAAWCLYLQFSRRVRAAYGLES